MSGEAVLDPLSVYIFNVAKNGGILLEGLEKVLSGHKASLPCIAQLGPKLFLKLKLIGHTSCAWYDVP